MKKSSSPKKKASSEKAGDNKSPKDNFLIVGLGASAGGIQALQEFFEQVPKDSGIAYVVILHLSPKHESHLSEVLQATSKVPVAKVTEKVRVKPDQVYVVPPDQHLTMKDGYIIVSKNRQIEDRRAPVDIFFRTLAESHGQMAVAVVLSGTGANGSMGLKRVKEKGGAAFVQNPREAEFNEMPRNAIATDLVDDVLPVAEIPQKIIDYKKILGKVDIPVEVKERPEKQQEALREIFTQLKVRTGHDFSNYKRPTLLRRIERRISVRDLTGLPAYVAFIKEHPEETQALLKDLLISVTNFFRDKEAFNALEQNILPSIFQNKSPEDQVRIWVVGCATGEEAYSMAMLCAERTLGVIDAPKVQVFATDIDEHAIAIAREGYYTLNDAADVSVERLRRFFNKAGEGYRIRREIREMVMFAHHNVLKDPPFSRLDLVSCRNMMIYLNGAAQERVMETFHFALHPGSYLFLGTSESAGGAGNLFSSVDREHHIFQSRPVAVRPLPVPESVPTFRIEHPPQQEENQNIATRQRERASYGDLHGRLLEQYAPPSVIVNEEYDIMHLSENAGRYLKITGGEPSNNLLKLIRPELRIELRTALYQAVQRKKNVEARNLKANTERINIHVRPVLRDGDSAKGFILILFEPFAGKTDDEEAVSASDSPIAHQLEEELTHVKAQLRTSGEQHEVQAEELKASNEELQALNEELRSAAEELETSKEELQSINEELSTVNQELKVKIEELSHSSNNLQNLINSANIATVFLDRSFRINFFTPSAREIFNLIPADQGRPIADITNRLEYKDLLPDAEAVLEKLQPVEKEVRTTDDRSYLMRIVPYRTDEDRINGIVIIFVDITERRKTEDQLRKSKEQMRLLIKSATDYSIFTTDAGGIINSWSEGAKRIFGWLPEEVIGQPADILYTPEDRAAGRPQEELEEARKHGSTPDERFHIRKDGSRFYVSGTVSAIYDTELIGFVKIARDMTERRKTDKALRESEERLRIILDAAEMGAWDLDLANNNMIWNKQQYILLGLDPAKEDNKDKELAYFLQFIHSKDVEKVSKELKTAAEKDEVFNAQFRITRADDGEKRWMNGYGRKIKNKDGDSSRLVGVMYDITEGKLMERQKDEFIGVASHELKTPVTSIKMYVELIRQTLEENGDVSENVELMKKLDKQVDRLMELIRDLLDTTKIAEGKLALNLTQFDLNKLIEESIEDFQSGSGKHDIIFKPEKLPQITADRERIAQVIVNFISNAIKYSPEGGEVIIVSEKLEKVVKVSVRDKGIGIPDELRSKIFNRFSRLNNSQTFPGIGLGLYISAEIIHRHGGTISVESEPEKGSVFYFTLPLE